MPFAEDEWEAVGEIGVDAGLVWIGDPCYVFHKNKLNSKLPEENDDDELPKELGKNWSEFCDILHNKMDNENKKAIQFNYDQGHPGLGVLTTTGYGDGSYRVEAVIKDSPGWGRRVHAIRVTFIEPESDSD